MKMKKKIKRGIAALSAAVMFLGLLPLTPDNTITVQAAGNEPSLATYATKAQLMDSTFAPKSDGTASNVGKIALGKDADGNVLQWYVLGKDDGVSGDNTAIFAASPIVNNVPFDSDTGEGDYYEIMGKYESNPEKVSASHYGASNLRNVLWAMASNNTYFSEAEKALMQTTTVQTWDAKNQTNYTTTDKLYVPTTDAAGPYSIKVGSSDDKILSSTSYWSYSSGHEFWTRKASSIIDAIYANASDARTVQVEVTEKKSVRPASNLNLSNVLFASAGKRGDNSFYANSPLTLRLDGTDKNIGTVTYDADAGVITTNKGTYTGGAVYLMVQGYYNGDKLYSTNIASGTMNIKVSNMSGAQLWLADIDLSQCKIWLEITASDGMIYAVNATPGTYVEPTKDKLLSITDPDPLTVTNGTNYWIIEQMLPETVDIVTENNTATSAQVEWNTDPLNGGYSATETKEQRVTLTGTVICPSTVDANGIELTTSITVIISGSGSTAPTQISSVDVTIESPKAGYPITETATCTTEGVSNTTLTWNPSHSFTEWGETYTASVTLTAASGYEFTGSTTATVNGKTVTPQQDIQGNLIVTYTFAATAQAKLKSITPPASVTAANGVAKTAVALGLPSTVTIEAEDLRVKTADVEWNLDNANYDPANNEEQKFTVNGTVKLPEKIDANGIDLNVAIEVTVSAEGATPATPTPAPVTPTPAPATPAPATPAPVSYYIMDGANSNWVRNEDGSMAIRGNGEFSKFTGVKVDGVLIDPANYIVTEGSTIVTLKPEYLDTLSEGSHSFEIMWADGSAATDFTVTGNAADYIAVNAPQTGYDSHKALWTLLLLAALSGLAASITKKSKVNQ